MPTTPVSELSRLSLGSSMPPATARHRNRASLSRAQPKAEVSSSEESDSEDSGLDEYDDDDNDNEQGKPTVIRSHSRLKYKIDELPLDMRKTVRKALREPPNMTLQRCRLNEDVYAFQMTELVTYTVRFGPSSQPWCRCMKENMPCKHVLWLMDQLAKQTLYNHNPETPLTLTPHGYPAEIGHPFGDISRFHLNLLADSLHCELDPITPTGSSSSDEDEDEDGDGAVDALRALEAQELLASVAGVAGAPPEKHRTDLFTNPRTGKKPLKRGDLECTVFRMLLQNHEFFHYFLSLTRPTDPIKDPFRKLSQRVTRLLGELDEYGQTLLQREEDQQRQQQQRRHAQPSSSTTDTLKLQGETPCDVPWAAHHIRGITHLIRVALSPRGGRPLSPAQHHSAARALVRTLIQVSEHNRDIHPGPSPPQRNLYAALIGHRDEGFIIDTLAGMPEAAAAYLHSLEVVRERLDVHGAPATYVARFDELLAILRTIPPPARTSPTGAGSKRQGQAHSGDRDPKRVK